MDEEIGIVAKIVANELQEKPLKISPVLGKGFVNRVFLVETSNSKIVVRINELNSLDEYQKEKWSVNQALEKNISTPKILKIGVFDDCAYSIQKYIQGVEGRDFPADKKFIWKKLGEYASRIHLVEVGGFGLQFSDMTHGDSQKLWLKYLNYNIESLNETDELLRLNVLTNTQSKRVREIFERLKARKFAFGLNHGDISLKNTIIDKLGTVHLIDWGSAEASIVPHHDLIQLLKMNMLENNPDETEIKAFLNGYNITNEEFELILPDLRNLSLLRAFDKLRWAIDWEITNLEDYIFQAKETVKRFLL